MSSFIADHEDLFERSEEKASIPTSTPAPGVGVTAATEGGPHSSERLAMLDEMEEGDPFQDGSISEIDTSMYLPFQDDDTRQHASVARKTRQDLTGPGPETGTGTGRSHSQPQEQQQDGLQSDVLRFIHEEEFHQNESSPQTSRFKQTYHSRNENDDVLLGTNLLQSANYGTLSSLDSDTLLTPGGPHQDHASSSSPVLPGPRHDSIEENDDFILSSYRQEEAGQKEDKENQESKPIRWITGRAPLELIETALALDIFVSAVRFDSTDFSSKVLSPFSSF
jgi:hypothetical protein